jgi:hypothetical protein
VQEETIAVPVKELKELRKAFFMLKGLFDTSIEYAERITPADEQASNHKVLINNLAIGKNKSQQLFDKAKKLESGL